jgi:predicted outer membrane repeat protein
VANNTTLSDGGGIAAETSFSLLNVLLFGNIAEENGGGVFALGSGKISSLTIDDNVAVGSGGGIDIASGAVKITNTIVALNGAASSGHDCAGGFSSQGFNLIFDTSGCSISGQTLTNIVGLDPKLDSPEHFDQVLIQRSLAGSPVLGAGGHCPATDELLNPHPHTGCAIGAIESP